MQKFILFLDEPTYAFAIVLFTIFVCSGSGSLLSKKIARVLPQVILGLGLLALLYPLLLPYFFKVLLGEPLILRLLVTLGALAPLSLLMGIPFPSGIRIIGALSPNSIPWAWGINGCISVVSSILSLMLAMSVGFVWVLVSAGGLYLVTAIIIYYWVRKIKQRPLENGGLPSARLT